MHRPLDTASGPLLSASEIPFHTEHPPQPCLVVFIAAFSSSFLVMLALYCCLRNMPSSCETFLLDVTMIHHECVDGT